MTQTAAIFVDAYRELNSKRMFWVVLALSAVVVAAFAMVGINQRGVTFLWFEWDMFYNTKVVSKAMFYNWVFSTFGLGYWLNWAAMILALISTAGMVPDLITGGAVDLYVSKPIGRLRLFLTKYAASVLFVALQVTIFTVASFFVIGIRGDSWDPKLFMAIPLTVLCYSYLYCVCVLLGLWTRSTVSALLLTILFWLIVWGLYVSESGFLMSKTAGEMETRAYERQFVLYGGQIDRLKGQAETNPRSAARLVTARKERDDLLARRDATEGKRQTMRTAHAVFYDIRSFLPKTAELSMMLERDLNEKEEELFTRPEERKGRGFDWSAFGGGEATEVKWDNKEVTRVVQREIRSRPGWWIVGTSVGFEVVVLGVASWIFCRRDF